MKITSKLTYASLLALSYAPAALAAGDPLKEGSTAAKPDGIGKADDLTTSFHTIANILIFLVGAISVIVLIYGGFLYVVSTGDQGRVKQAKETIQYAIIGIIVAILAYAIVAFVTTSLIK